VFPHRTAQGYDALYVIDPRMMTAQENSMELVDRIMSWRCTRSIDGQNVFLPEEIIHIKFADPDMENVRGLSRMASCGKNVELMNAIKEWNISTTNNGAKPSIAVNIPQRLTQDQRNELKNDLRNGYQGKSNAGNGMILDDGKTATMLGMTAVEMDYQKGLVNAAKEIAIAYGIPPEMMGDSANKTYSNAQEASRQIVVNTIKPLLNLVYSAIWQFFKDKPIAQGIGEYTYDVEQLSDFMGVQTDLYTALQSASFLTANDKRKKLGYDPVDDPLADELMLTMADVPMSEYSADSLDPGRTDPEKDDLKVLLGESS
jgi:HK97 family phage portal protein